MNALQYGFVVCKFMEGVLVWQCDHVDRVNFPPISDFDRRARVLLPLDRWKSIKPAFQEEIFERVKDKKTKLNLSKFPQLLPSSIGKELCVLCWSLELANDNQIQRITRNWRGLAPEERWWLYNITAANSSQARQKNIGWRKALYLAFSEEGK